MNESLTRLFRVYCCGIQVVLPLYLPCSEAGLFPNLVAETVFMQKILIVQLEIKSDCAIWQTPNIEESDESSGLRIVRAFSGKAQ